MDLQLSGSRPPSARAQSRINPITGEEMPYPTARESARQPPASQQPPIIPMARGEGCAINGRPAPIAASRAACRPHEVPRLNLGPLRGKDDDPDYTLEMDPYNYKLESPGTASTVSWGTPTSAYKQYPSGGAIPGLKLPVSGRSQPGANSQRSQATPKVKKPTAWDKQAVPENLPPPSQRYKDQYQQLEQEMRDSYRQKNMQAVTEEDIERRIEKLQLNIPLYQDEEEQVVVEEDDSKDAYQKVWTQEPYSKAHLLRKQDKDDLESENRKKKLIETMMIDQLSRPVISQADVNGASSVRPSSHRRGLRGGAARSQRDSRIKTDGSSTENLLSRRIRFGARVLSREGRDAIRELTGFFFAVDNSLTIYEFRQFGKSAKALPFIKRGVYEHVRGRKRGSPYTLKDLIQGQTLVLETREQPLPESMKARELAALRITDVDDEAKAEILFDRVPVQQQDEVWKKAHLPQTTEEVEDRLLLLEVQDCVRRQIKKRGIKVYTGLGRLYRQLDESKDGRLNKVELDKSLIDFHVDVPQEKFDDLWEQLDCECTSFLEYDEFLRGFLGEMSERRKVLVRKAFLKMDGNKKGFLTLEELRKFYNVYKHPKVRAGECSEEEVLESFLSHFQDTGVKGQVSYWEFELYYEGLSACIEVDEDFANILSNSWSI